MHGRGLRPGVLALFIAILAGSPAPGLADQGTVAGKPKPLFVIAPPPEPDPRARAAEGKIVRSITIAGNKHTKEYIIRRELELEVGKPFRLETMDDDLCRLENLGIFSSISFIPTPLGADSLPATGAALVGSHHAPNTFGIAAIDSVLDVSQLMTPGASAGDSVDLAVTVREMPWIVPYPAMKISDQTGFSFGLGAASGNLFGRDITLSAKALFGGASTYQMKLDWPWITGDHVSFNLVTNHLVRDDAVRDFQEKSYEITPWFGTYLGEHGRLRAGYSYFSIRSDVDGVTLSDDDRDILHRAGVALGYDTRDSWINPHRGWDTEVQVVRTGGFLGGDGDYVTTDLDVTRYQPAGRHTFVISGLSSLQTGELGEEIPSYMNYLMGGSNTVRGYRLKELGKELSGKNQLIGTLEYQY
ncbi:MAG TPA: BamA/TamA family outer membrane protein, partial [Candidatus Udaeobacter sp.]|nr:BamA/TamA family outer membrane protein [Candidatus Udaeobacter sp.]